MEEHLDLIEGEAYVPEKGDQADEHLAHYVNEAGLDLKITRVEKGTYQIGDEKVVLQLVNDKLAVRTGGGFTNMQQFLERYKQ